MLCGSDSSDLPACGSHIGKSHSAGLDDSARFHEAAGPRITDDGQQLFGSILNMGERAVLEAARDFRGKDHPQRLRAHLTTEAKQLRCATE